MIRDFAAPAIIMVTAVYLLWGTLLSHDISWYLISTGWWLDGLRIYADILELNPPLAFYLTAIPVWVARVGALAPMAAFKGFVLVLVAGSLMLSQRLLVLETQLSPAARRAVLAVAAVGLLLLPVRDFGQREHLFAILFLPFLVMNLLSRPAPGPLRAGVAVWATFGIALKHYFLLLPLSILACQVIAARSFRPVLRVEYLLMAAMLALYVVTSAILHPAYFESVVPLTLQVYGAFDAPLLPTLFRAAIPVILLLIAWGFLGMNRTRPGSNAVAVLTAAAAIAVYLIQSKGWSYHLIPANVFAVMAVTWTAMTLSQARKHWWPGVVAAAFVMVVLAPELRHGPYKSPFAEAVEPFFACAPGERSFQIFSSTVSTGFPLANYAKATPANRAPTLWLFPGASYRLSLAEDPAEKAIYLAILQDARARVLKDFFRVVPQVVIVDESPQKKYFNGVPFDYLAFFSEDKRFSKAWRDYSLAGHVGTFAVYSREGCDLAGL
ncbi:hypothetical protein [Rhodovulum marinum]|uniref:4-amino-4-deoxy-L-arabinose transferase-like glycosyltransferase n=1 Tax=Rhodovulum marinum TaxID=320662 RepID=A0A4R2Q3R9_9RHOB|nr:hypothetical protein [Rhodovulum marinum]TCP42368.1 hypothetical protein EV662_103276 [Rhodovulum marinum]